MISTRIGACSKNTNLLEISQCSAADRQQNNLPIRGRPRANPTPIRGKIRRRRFASFESLEETVVLARKEAVCAYVSFEEQKSVPEMRFELMGTFFSKQ